MKHYQKGVEILKAEKKQLKKRVDRVNAARKEADRLRRQSTEMRALITFLEETLPARAQARVRFFKDLRLVIPEDVELDNLIQGDLTHYELRGRGLRAASVTRFGTRLRDLDEVKDINIPAIEEVPIRGALPPSAKRVLYRFVINVTLAAK